MSEEEQDDPVGMLSDLISQETVVADIPKQTAATPEPSTWESAEDFDLLFEIRYRGQNVSVTKKRLFALARQGDVSPDDVITVAGTKIFADSIQGIVFDVAPPVAAASPPLPPVEPEHANTYAVAAGAVDLFDCYELEKNVAAPVEPPVLPVDSPAAAAAEETFDIASEPHAQVAQLPRAQQDKKSFFSDLWETLDTPLSQASTEANRYYLAMATFNSRYVKIGGAVLATLCLLGMLVYWLVPQAKSTCGAVRIVGTVKLEGAPAVGASVILHPRNEKEGRAAVGVVNKRGIFTVTTDPDPLGCGAIPGEYVVTFSKRGMIPRLYEDPKTSGLVLKVEPKGKNRFKFELVSAASPMPQERATPILPKDDVVTPLPEAETALTDVQVHPPLEPVLPLSRFQNIFEAAASGTVQEVEDYLRANPTSIRATDNTGNTSLHYAARSNTDAAVLRFLIGKGAMVNAKNMAGRTPLDVAMASNQAPLRAAGAVSTVVVPQSPSPPLPYVSSLSNILHAAMAGTFQDVEYFVGKDPACVNETGTDGGTPLHRAAIYNPDVAVFEYLISKNADAKVEDHAGNTPLHCAAKHNSEAVLQYLIPRAANINAKNKAGMTPFDIANTAEKKELLAKAGGKSGETARPPTEPAERPESPPRPLLFVLSNIFEAAEKGTVQNVEAFLEEGVHVNVKDGAGWTPLHHAASSLFNTDAKVLEYLISRGADVNAKDNRGMAPLDAANTGAKRDILEKNGGKRNWTH